LFSYPVPGGDALAAQQPQHDDDDQDDSQNAAEPRAAIIAMRVISAAAAEQQHHDYDDDDEVQIWSFWLANVATERTIRLYFCCAASRIASLAPPTAF
jgi:hypothetical protein